MRRRRGAPGGIAPSKRHQHARQQLRTARRNNRRWRRCRRCINRRRTRNSDTERIYKACEHRHPCKVRCQQRIVGCRRKQREHCRNEHDKFHRTAHRGLRQHLHQHANSQRECGSNDKECGQYAAQHSSALHQRREAELRINTRIRGRTVEQLARFLLQRHVRQGVLPGQGHFGKPDELLHLLVHRLRQTGSGNMV